MNYLACVLRCVCAVILQTCDAACRSAFIQRAVLTLAAFDICSTFMGKLCRQVWPYAAALLVDVQRKEDRFDSLHVGDVHMIVRQVSTAGCPG